MLHCNHACEDTTRFTEEVYIHARIQTAHYITFHHITAHDISLHHMTLQQNTLHYLPCSRAERHITQMRARINYERRSYLSKLGNYSKCARMVGRPRRPPKQKLPAWGNKVIQATRPQPNCAPTAGPHTNCN